MMNPGSTLRPSSLPKNDDIAIIGLACRFPGGASDEAKLWDLLSNRKCMTFYHLDGLYSLVISCFL